MSNMIEVDLDLYLSDDEKRVIARETFRAVAAKTAAKDFERILSNAGYHLVQLEVDAAFDGNMVDEIKAKSIEVIRKLTDFTVFRKPDAWGTDPSKGWLHLQAAMDEAAPLIRQRVNEIVEAMTYDDLRSLVEDKLADVIVAKLTAKEAR